MTEYTKFSLNKRDSNLIGGTYLLCICAVVLGCALQLNMKDVIIKLRRGIWLNSVSVGTGESSLCTTEDESKDENSI